MPNNREILQGRLDYWNDAVANATRAVDYAQEQLRINTEAIAALGAMALSEELPERTPDENS